MIEFLKRIFLSKAAKVVYLFALFFGYAAALFAGIFIPIHAHFGFFAIPIATAVIVAGPSYYKAFKWCLNGAMNANKEK